MYPLGWSRGTTGTLEWASIGPLVAVVKDLKATPTAARALGGEEEKSISSVPRDPSGGTAGALYGLGKLGKRIIDNCASQLPHRGLVALTSTHPVLSATQMPF